MMSPLNTVGIEVVVRWPVWAGGYPSVAEALEEIARNDAALRDEVVDWARSLPSGVVLASLPTYRDGGYHRMFEEPSPVPNSVAISIQLSVSELHETRAGPGMAVVPSAIHEDLARRIARVFPSVMPGETGGANAYHASATSLAVPQRALPPLTDRTLHRRIVAAIDDARAAWETVLRLAAVGAEEPLVIKYVPAQYARRYISGAAPLRISSTPGYTWGTGTYVAPLQHPVSTAIYGRVGAVCPIRDEPLGWNVFDARSRQNQDLYRQWAFTRPAARMLMLTAHANFANQTLRDLFKCVFEIDCILLPPDEGHWHYTRRSDVWMCVSDWSGQGRLAEGDSVRLRDARAVVTTEEEFFASERAPWVRDPHLGPVIVPRDPDVVIQRRLVRAFNTRTIEVLRA